jgi:hypothetical protein
MKFLMMVKGSAASEAGVMPSERLMADMGRFNEEMGRAGILRAAEGLHPSREGARIRYHGTGRTVVPGPFAQADQLVAGFWVIEVGSLDEAIAWMKRCPNPHDGGDGTVESEVEIRQLFTGDDFGAALTPALRAQEEALRDRIEAR